MALWKPSAQPASFNETWAGERREERPRDSPALSVPRRSKIEWQQGREVRGKVKGSGYTHCGVQ